MIASRMSLTGARAAAFKIAADQTTLMPFFVVVFFIFQAKLEGLSMEKAIQRTSTAFWPTVVLCAPYYCTVHTVTFGFLPVKHRLAWSSLCAVGWTAYISYANQKLREEEERVVTSKGLSTDKGQQIDSSRQ